MTIKLKKLRLILLIISPVFLHHNLNLWKKNAISKHSCLFTKCQSEQKAIAINTQRPANPKLYCCWSTDWGHQTDDYSLSLSLFVTHTHTHKHTLTHSLSLPLTHSNTLTHTLSLSPTHSLKHARTLTPIYGRIHLCVCAWVSACACVCMCVYCTRRL